MPVKFDLTGQRFGRLVALYYVGSIRKESMWRVKCDCGCEFTTHSRSLRRGLTRSCGCLNKEIWEKHRRCVQKGDKRGPYKKRSIKQTFSI